MTPPPATHPVTPTDLPLHWQPSTTARVLATVAAVALAAAVLSARWQLAVYAAPFVGALASPAWLRRPPSTMRIGVPYAPIRCFEGETVEVPFAVDATGPACRVAPEPQPGLTVWPSPDIGGGATGLRVRTDRWGRYPVQVRVGAIAAGGLLRATARFEVAQVRVYPNVEPGSASIPRTELPTRIGTHLTAHHGLGVEYADIRGYLPGDQLRSINWAVSARRRRLHVTERYTDRAADVVALIDSYPAAPGPAAEGLEWAVRGATQVLQSALQIGDRAGVVALGVRVRWLAPDIGHRQFYRVLDSVLDSAPSADDPCVAETCADPFTEELDPLTARMWRLGRAAMHRDLRVLGVDVVEWVAGVPLEQALVPLLRARPRPQRRSRRANR